MEESAENEETNDCCGKHNLKNLSGYHELAIPGFKSVIDYKCWSYEPADSKMMNEQFHLKVCLSNSITKWI